MLSPSGLNVLSSVNLVWFLFSLSRRYDFVSNDFEDLYVAGPSLTIELEGQFPPQELDPPPP